MLLFGLYKKNVGASLFISLLSGFRISSSRYFSHSYCDVSAMYIVSS